MNTIFSIFSSFLKNKIYHIRQMVANTRLPGIADEFNLKREGVNRSWEIKFLFRLKVMQNPNGGLFSSFLSIFIFFMALCDIMC